jgi:hypothetical protein
MKILNEVVLDALDLHAAARLPRLKFGQSKCRLVVASGNALPTGKILFQGESCIFADEGQYEQVLKTRREIDSAVVISASGKKHAPVIVKHLLARKLPTYLLTCATPADAGKFLPPSRVFTTKSIPEPITYNTSTYMGMMLARTREDAKQIKRHLLQRVRPALRRIDFTKYSAFYLMVRPEFDLMREMFVTKFDELFGPRLVGRCYTEPQTFHAKTVVPSEEELFISFGVKNRFFGTKRLEIPLPPKAGPVAMMATGYYVIGRIQEQFPPWFKQNAEQYARFQKSLPF